MLGNISSSEESQSSLQVELNKISEKCTKCEECQKGCKFLRKYGKPKEIAEAYYFPDKAYPAMSFECSLCQLCAAVCPQKLNPAGMFLEMRREKTKRFGNFPEHKGMLAYERRGTSRRFTYYAIPEKCHTIFFPGCTLPGSRPDKTFKLYEYMKKDIPELGIVLDCCMKISHDLGRKEYFTAMFQEMKDFLLVKGIRKVIVACPNCHRMFKEYGKELSVKTVYEIMAENGPPLKESVKGIVTIHDPCPVRYEGTVHSAIRNLVKSQGLTIEEMDHHREKTLCCGEGGSVGCLSPDLSKSWGVIRKKEANGERIITYCAGCTYLLNRITPTSHVLDLLFEPKATLAGKIKVSSVPMTYINRLRLKNRFKKTIHAPITWERGITVRR